MSPIRLQADFNGLFGDVLCLSHSETCRDETGAAIPVQAGLLATAFEEDSDRDGNPDELFATGTVQPAPDWLACKGSRWVLRIDANGVRHASDLHRS